MELNNTFLSNSNPRTKTPLWDAGNEPLAYSPANTIGKEICDSHHWIPALEPIYSIMDNASGRGTNDAMHLWKVGKGLQLVIGDNNLVESHWGVIFLAADNVPNADDDSSSDKLKNYLTLSS
jgi:hypothetical protein